MAHIGPTTVHGAGAGIYSNQGQRRTVTPMTDARMESFLADVLALEGENPDAIREGVYVALGDCEEIFKAQEVNRPMKDEGQGDSRLPRPLPRSNHRRHAASEGNGHRRALEVRSERYRWATLRLKAIVLGVR